MFGDSWLKESDGRWHLYWCEGGHFVHRVYAGKDAVAAEKFRDHFERAHTTTRYRYGRGRRRPRFSVPPSYGSKRQARRELKKASVAYEKANLSRLVIRQEIIIHLLKKLVAGAS